MGFATPIADWSIKDKTINNIIQTELEPKKISQLFEKIQNTLQTIKI